MESALCIEDMVVDVAGFGTMQDTEGIPKSQWHLTCVVEPDSSLTLAKEYYTLKHACSRTSPLYTFSRHLPVPCGTVTQQNVTCLCSCFFVAFPD